MLSVQRGHVLNCGCFKLHGMPRGHCSHCGIVMCSVRCGNIFVRVGNLVRSMLGGHIFRGGREQLLSLQSGHVPELSWRVNMLRVRGGLHVERGCCSVCRVPCRLEHK